MDCICVIPARYGSSRFPGKPLHIICEKPMIQWVYEHCKQVKMFKKVIIATDNEKIQTVAESFGAEVVMTPSNCPSPTERLFLVSEKYRADYYVMVNGDEPTLPPNIINKCIPDKIDSSGICVYNLMTKCNNPSDVIDSTNIKVVVNKLNDCIYMSRSPIPFPKGKQVEKYRKFVGVTGFTKPALDFYHITEPGEVESIEDVDEIRFVENGKKVKFIEVEYESLSVDTIKDTIIVEECLKNWPQA